MTSQDVHPLQELLIALLLGLLVGIQRQWAASKLGGIRTFSFITTFGAVCALLADKYGPMIVAVGLAGTIGAMLLGHVSRRDQQEQKSHKGLGTEFAMLLMFAVGVLVHRGPLWLATALTGMIAVLLQFKLELHGLVTRFSRNEIKAIMQFVLIALVIFPIMPNQIYGPYHVLNPHEIWLMIILIVSINLIGYIAYKFFGARAGGYLAGVLGGLISSTATTMSYARESKKLSHVKHCALVISIAWSVLFVRVFVEALIAAPQFAAIRLPLIIMLATSVLTTLLLWKTSEKQFLGMPLQKNPAELLPAFGFGLLYCAILLAVAISQHTFGKSGLVVISILSGITDVDAMTLSTSRLVATGKLTHEAATISIIIAIASNVFFKGIMTLLLGSKTLYKKLFWVWLLTISSGLLSLYFLHFIF